ncbi:MAG TPA: Bax inhibitor-1/YccA family protein [Planctomicrobium sp.]|nr:Bax inhibitor-1/YccA family protein [Planctomicrobium sp.]
MRTGNPTLNDKTFDRFDGMTASEQTNAMTLNGTATKTLMLMTLVVGAGAFTWNLFLQQNPLVGPLMIGGAIAGLIFALITTFKPTWAPVTSPIYAVCQGLMLGGVSAMYQSLYDGIVVQAVFLTLGTLFAMLLAYQSGFIRATEKFKMGVMAATGGIFIAYLAMFALSFFGVQVPYIHGSGLIGIGFSLFVVIIAALNLVLDFDFIEQGVERGAPKYMEWYGAFGLLVTLVWLYIEVLRLLGKLNSRD